jgi:hypothetical protein
MCQLTVQTPEGVWQGDVDSWTGFVVLAALSAEPENFDELAEAVRRYQPEHQLFDPPWDQTLERLKRTNPGAWWI